MPPSTAVLDANFKNMTQEVKEMKEEMRSNHLEIKQLITCMEEKFVLKSSFRAVVTALGALATVIGIILYFNK